MFLVSEDTQLSENFRLKEFQCKDGSKTVLVNYLLVVALQALRSFLQKAIVISSGYRTREHNKRSGGISTSHHLTGKAADIKVKGMTPLEVAKAADKLHLFTGIGIYGTFTHVDVGHQHLYWYINKHTGLKIFVKSLDVIKEADYA